MCLAIPTQIKALHDDQMATVVADDIEQQVSVELLDDVNVGDYVIIHVGYALEKLDPNEAEQTLEMFSQLEHIPQAS